MVSCKIPILVIRVRFPGDALQVLVLYFGLEHKNREIPLVNKHRWCSGIIQDSHSCDLGSIPGRCERLSLQVLVLYFRNEYKNLEITFANKHRWCSGIMQDSHSCDPGSIPGRCKSFSVKVLFVYSTSD